MKQSPSTSVEHPLTIRPNVYAINSNSELHPAASSTETTEDESTDKPLKSICDKLTEICDLLGNRVRSEEDQRYEADKENEMKNDWMLAAAVLDRICAIAVTVIFVMGTVMIFTVCIMHVHP